MKFSSTSNTSVQRCLYPLFQYQWSILFEECLNHQVRIKKMVNEHAADYQPSPLELASRIDPLIFLCPPKGFISAEYSLNILSNLYIPPWLWKRFKITGKYICESKNWICSFLLMHIVQTIPLPLPFKISPLTPNIKKHYVLYTSFTPVYPLLTINSMQFKDPIKNLFEVCNT